MPDTSLPPLSLPDGDEPLARPRRPRSWRERAEHLADATGTTPARIAVGAALAAVAVGAALWLTRPASPPPEVSLPFASTAPGGTASARSGDRSTGAAAATTAVSSDPTTAPVDVVVDVEGAVLQRGIRHLHVGARVADAVAAAGGLGPTADGARLNLAAVLQDGQRVYVPAVGEQPPPVVAPGASSTGTGGDAQPAAVDLNRADAAALEALPGVGPALAAAIIQHREQIGGFTSVDQLGDVRGIGPAKLDQLRPLVTV